MENKVKVSAIVSCFNGAKYLSEFLENCAEQTLASQIEIVLVHNQPTESELKIVKDFQERHPGLVNHVVVPREPLAVSTNRAIFESSGEYVCIWNVDDLRTSNSLENMARVLDENADVDFTYGDYIIVHGWKKQTGKLITNPEFDRKAFVRSMILGPFYMWRKKICEKMGYWDEQFKSGADFDHSVRLALAGKGKKTSELLGYYLDEGLGLSTGKTPWQAIERTFIEIRYGIYSKLDAWYYKRARKYNATQILQKGEWVPIEKLCPNYLEFSENKFIIVYSFFMYPFRFIKRTARFALKKLKTI